jgi:Ca-activated chloride channel family protein
MPFRRPGPRPLPTLLLLLGLALVAPAPELDGAQGVPAELTPEHRDWLAEVRWLITPEEHAAFVALEKDYQRDAFIERFWQVRDPYPDTPRNELRDTWEARVSQARQEFASMDEDRARFFLLNGAPSGNLEVRCASLWPLDIWVYEPSERLPEPLILIFYQGFAQGEFRLWEPSIGLHALFQFARVEARASDMLNEILNSCTRGDQIVAGIQHVMRMGFASYGLLVSRAQKPIEPPSREWVETFASYSTDLPEDATRLPGELTLAFPGRRQSRTVMQATVALPVAKVGAAEIPGARIHNFLLNGEVLIQKKLFDSFRYKFDLPASQVTSESIPLVFERFLRPGDYRLIVRVEDLNSGAVYRDEREVSVPELADLPTTTVDEETEKLLAEANAVLASLETTIQIVQPRAQFQSGLQRFDTLTSEGIREVEFLLDGRSILRKNRPPYSVELDLGEVPRTRRLRAVAFDAAGREVAVDEEMLNASPHRFSVRLIEPRRGQRYQSSLRAEAQVELPEGATLERVEFYLNDTLLVTLFQEPFTQPIVLPPAEEIAYVRAVAYQTDGNSTEDLVFVNAPANLEEVDVQFVELFTTVLDRQQRPVADLGESSFAVREDGVPQQIARFEQVQNLPIHVAVLIDVSASMGPMLGQARAAALEFFRGAIQPRDRAALIPFNDRPLLSVKMTARQEDLEAGLAGLKAERGTALNDSVVFALFYFNGIKGQRAILLLSDGKDEHSKFTFDQTLDFARRAGVAIYSIGIDVKRTDGEHRKLLKSLAEETGGRSFFIDEVTELGPIYAAIQRELRSRYLIAYQSTNSSRDARFRTVEVELDRSGLEAKTLRGYYP